MKSTAERPKRRNTYDPGQPAGIQTLNFREGTFLVIPFDKPNAPKKSGEYHIDLAARTCTCEHFCYRIAPKREQGESAPDCKHIEYAAEHSFKIALSVSRQLTATSLRQQLLRADLRPEIHEAVQQVTNERQWARMNARPGSLPLASIIEQINRRSDEAPALATAAR